MPMRMNAKTIHVRLGVHILAHLAGVCGQCDLPVVEGAVGLSEALSTEVAGCVRSQFCQRAAH